VGQRASSPPGPCRSDGSAVAIPLPLAMARRRPPTTTTVAVTATDIIGVIIGAGIARWMNTGQNNSREKPVVIRAIEMLAPPPTAIGIGLSRGHRPRHYQTRHWASVFRQPPPRPGEGGRGDGGRGGSRQGAWSAKGRASMSWVRLAKYACSLRMPRGARSSEKAGGNVETCSSGFVLKPGGSGRNHPPPPWGSPTLKISLQG